MQSWSNPSSPPMHDASGLKLQRTCACVEQWLWLQVQQRDEMLLHQLETSSVGPAVVGRDCYWPPSRKVWTLWSLTLRPQGGSDVKLQAIVVSLLDWFSRLREKLQSFFLSYNHQVHCRHPSPEGCPVRLWRRRPQPARVRQREVFSALLSIDLFPVYLSFSHSLNLLSTLSRPLLPTGVGLHRHRHRLWSRMS